MQPERGFNASIELPVIVPNQYVTIFMAFLNGGYGKFSSAKMLSVDGKSILYNGMNSKTALKLYREGKIAEFTADGKWIQKPAHTRQEENAKNAPPSKLEQWLPVGQRPYPNR